MAEYIEREELVRHCKRIIEAEHNQISAPSSWSFAYEQFIEDLEEEPTADVVEVRHGEWLTKEYFYGKDGECDGWVEKPAENGDCAYCSSCHEHALLNGGEEYELSNYCPNCGAKMDKEN